MDTFRNIEITLSELKQRHFKMLSASFRWPEELRAWITGAVQFYAVDKPKRAPSDRLPVICTVGINYTQGGKRDSALFPYAEAPGPGVARPTASAQSVKSVIAAYERNKVAWTTRPAVNPGSPLGFYGAADATRKMRPIDYDFILV